MTKKIKKVKSKKIATVEDSQALLKDILAQVKKRQTFPKRDQAHLLEIIQECLDYGDYEDDGKTYIDDLWVNYHEAHDPDKHGFIQFLFSENAAKTFGYIKIAGLVDLANRLNLSVNQIEVGCDTTLETSGAVYIIIKDVSVPTLQKRLADLRKK